MAKRALMILLICTFLITSCEKPKEEITLNPEDFEIREAKWDTEIEFDCKKCDKPVCEWTLAWELTYKFNPTGWREEAVCWYIVDDKIKIKPLLGKNKIVPGVNKLFDPDLTVDCREDHKVGLCCAYTQEELLNEKYVCKDILLEKLCP